VASRADSDGTAPDSQFGALLRTLRIAAGLTQEALAARSGLSAQAISLLERGARRSPRPSTVVLLSTALRLTPAQADALLAASHRGAEPGETNLTSHGTETTANVGGPVPAVIRTLPRDISTFTGREEELNRLLTTVFETARAGRAVAISAIDGMAGAGKTAFAVHAAHRMAAEFPDGQIFLDLRAHTAEQQPVTPGDALGTLLMMSGVIAQLVPPDLEERAAMWRDRTAGKRMLILLDDAAGHDQIRPLLPGAAGCLVLVTSRRRLAALEDVEPITLGTLPPEHATALFTRLIRDHSKEAEPGAIGALVDLCGYLPLAIRIVAGRLRSHTSWRVGYLVDLLATAQDRLVEMHAEDIAVRAAFELSYHGLPEDQKCLFRRLGLHPGPDIDAYAAAALDDSDVGPTRRRLDALQGDHLIDEPVAGRYRLHDLLHIYARTLASQDESDGQTPIERLLDYYLHAAVTANRHIAQTSGPSRVLLSRPPIASPDLSTRASALAWLDAERSNLLACFNYAVTHSRHDHSVSIAHALHGFLRIAGHWNQALAVHHAAYGVARLTGDRRHEAEALNDLGIVQRLTDQPQAAVASLKEALTIARELGDIHGEANVLTELGAILRFAGEYRAATDALSDAMVLFSGLGDRLGQANALHGLGIVQHLSEQPDAAKASLTEALVLYHDLDTPVGRASTLHDLANAQRMAGDYAAATASLTAALPLFHELRDRLGQANILNGLGIVCRLTGRYHTAAASFAEALALYREVGSRLGQANALQGLGAVFRLTGEYRDAIVSLTEALTLYRDVGSRLGRANALHQLGAVLRLTGDDAAATECLTEALALCRDLGSRHGRANALHELGVVQRQTGNAAAIDSLTEALGLFGDVRDRHGEAEVLNSLGAALVDRGSMDDAIALHRRALGLSRDIGCPLEQARALEGIGLCLARALRTSDGIDYLRRALAVYRRLGAADTRRTRATLISLGCSDD